MMELRSVINSGRSSRASSHRSTRSRRVEVESERPRIESTGLSDTETPGLESVTESDTEQEDWYEPANRSRSAPVNHEDPNPRAVESASAAFNRRVMEANRHTQSELTYPVPQRIRNPRLSRVNEAEIPTAGTRPIENRLASTPYSAREANTPAVPSRMREDGRRAPHEESPDSSPSDSDSDDGPQNNFRRDTLPHVRRGRAPFRGRGGHSTSRRDLPPARRQPSPPSQRDQQPPARRPRSPPARRPRSPPAGHSRSPPVRRSRSPPDRRPQRRGRNPLSSPSPSGSSPEPSRHRTPFDNVRPDRQPWPQAGAGTREMTGDEYSQRLLQYFEDMINLQVTHSIYYPRDFRGTRDAGPEPYDGTSDIDEFERWLHQDNWERLFSPFYHSFRNCS